MHNNIKNRIPLIRVYVRKTNNSICSFWYTTTEKNTKKSYSQNTAHTLRRHLSMYKGCVRGCFFFCGGETYNKMITGKCKIIIKKLTLLR